MNAPMILAPDLPAEHDFQWVHYELDVLARTRQPEMNQVAKDYDTGGGRGDFAGCRLAALHEGCGRYLAPRAVVGGANLPLASCHYHPLFECVTKTKLSSRLTTERHPS